MKVLIQFQRKPLLFQDPQRVISCYHPSSFKACFQDMERALREGYYLAGFFSYEAGYCFEDKLRKDKQYDFPLIYVGIYQAPRRENAISPRSGRGGFPQDLRLNITRQEYGSNIEAIRDYIAKGDVYQITYCIKLLFEFRGDGISFYNQLLKEQPV
ncbi:hypothetical protein EPN54_04490, partial [bacterium]